ncbi:carboxylate-amine ligase [Cognatishimia maritima]|uniref:Putative glutamate--cysteine ligase 2 n=1 Tax=Cognatishimia maritima TaxID=870908 RepID=A0A1M5JD06_9RHOB|nr:carboxylate-amine ligase [Cognatishimia maritima]SHG38391.1 carboxylate-amine ligase [Cognatishimia maritima]
MPVKAPDFTIGIEEEYLLVDKDSFDLAPAPEALMEECKSELQDQVSPEFLDCQIEIGTRVCQNVGEAREDLKRLRSTVARVAGRYNLAPIASSCHPFSDWRDQRHTDKDRYNALSDVLGGVARRMLICGMHVHVGIENREMRIDIMNQLSYFLPHLLALSGSSPFWQGDDTGLSCYRLTVFDNLPRTGLPQVMDSWGQWERSVEALRMLGVIEDSSKIWWDLRPSSKFPTLETRICDVSPRLETTLSLAAMNQALARMLYRLQTKNQRWRLYDNFLIKENRWRAQRYGTTEGLIDFGRREIVPLADLMRELQELIAEDMVVFKSTEAVENAVAIAENGNAAQDQRKVLQASLDAGKDQKEAMRDVVKFLTEEFHADL